VVTMIRSFPLWLESRAELRNNTVGASESNCEKSRSRLHALRYYICYLLCSSNKYIEKRRIVLLITTLEGNILQCLNHECCGSCRKCADPDSTCKGLTRWKMAVEGLEEARVWYSL
jgi:hypothetical protein